MNLPTEIILLVMLGWGSFELLKGLKRNSKPSPESIQFLQEQNTVTAVSSALDAISESPAASTAAEAAAEGIAATAIHTVEAIAHTLSHH